MEIVTAVYQKLGADILKATYQHIYLTFISLLIAILIAIPLGIFLAKTRFKKLSSLILNIAGVIQTIPSLALIALIIVVFALIRLPTIGRIPGIFALVLYALLPLLRNTYTGIKQVDANVIEVARGMGMRNHQILFLVELPLSLPVIITGIRIATVWTIGIATLVGLIGAGGLGDLILRGLRTIQMDYLLAGTIPAAILALISDFFISKTERWLTPKGLQ
jgi:osmoprotectant transport system permease protein